MSFPVEKDQSGREHLTGLARSVISALIVGGLSGGITGWVTIAVLRNDVQHLAVAVAKLEGKVDSAREDRFTGSEGRRLERRVHSIELWVARQGYDLKDEGAK